MLFKRSTSVQIYRRLLKAALPYWWAFALGLIGNALYATSDGCMTYFCKPLLERGLMNRDEGFIKILPLIVIAFFLARGLAYCLASYFMSWVGRSVVRDFRQKMISKLMCLPASFFDQRTSGELLSKINYDTDQVAEAISEAITSTIRGVLTTISLVVVMYNLNARITMLLIVAVPVLGMYIGKISRKMRKRSGEIQITMGRVTHVAGEVIGGYKVIRAFGGTSYENQRFAEAVDTNWAKELKMTATAAASVSGMQLIGACALAGFLYIATLKTGNWLGMQEMTPGSFVAMATAILTLLRPIKQVAVVNSILQRGIAGAKSIFALLDEAPEQDLGNKTLDRAKGAIVFNNVNFQYPLQVKNTLVLKDISFVIKPGETIALVGSSGGGKSTLVSLLPRFYDCTTGVITLDGEDIRNFCLEDLRKQFAMVTQHVVLFNDTIANNIAYGDKRNASSDEIYKAVKLAHALEFIEKLPKGLDTEIGENGVRLSGGQRQRLAIARAILKDAPILILDEATSALDTESEQHIQAALETLMKNRTTFVIAHRLSTIEHADKVLVIEDGRIVEFGSHEELIARNGRYLALQEAQLTEFSRSKEVEVLSE